MTNEINWDIPQLVIEKGKNSVVELIVFSIGKHKRYTFQGISLLLPDTKFNKNCEYDISELIERPYIISKKWHKEDCKPFDGEITISNKILRGEK